jgi:hypothetical protein
LHPNNSFEQECPAHHLRQKPDFQSAFVPDISPAGGTVKPLQ